MTETRWPCHIGGHYGGLQRELDPQAAQLGQRLVQQRTVCRRVEPPRDAAGVGQRNIDSSVALEELADGHNEWLFAEECVDGHLADQQHDPGLDQRQLELKEAAAESDLRR